MIREMFVQNVHFSSLIYPISVKEVFERWDMAAKSYRGGMEIALSEEKTRRGGNTKRSVRPEVRHDREKNGQQMEDFFTTASLRLEKRNMITMFFSIRATV
uniref:Uncharacterized protein n=1 Tax=Acrobeloides nanus TaxID=290746 RepID=A0A914EIP2_9BILA